MTIKDTGFRMLLMDGSLKCPKCDGTGEIICEFCDGTGELQAINDWTPCGYCNAHGATTCDFCKGSGKFAPARTPGDGEEAS